MFRLLIAVVPLFAAACEVPPRFVEESAQVDAFLLRSNYRSACVGLAAQDPDVRTHTAQRLAEAEHVKVANDCLCAALYDAETGVFAPAVAKGLARSRRDDLASCLLPALDDARIEDDDRATLVRSVGVLEAKAGYDALTELARNDPDPAVRTEAARALRPSRNAVQALVAIMASDQEASVRASAAEGLAGRKDDAAHDALRNALTTDAEGQVRAAAARALEGQRSTEIDAALCARLLEDDDESVRLAVVQGWHGTKRKRPLDCIERRMKAFEESGTVRETILAALGASPSDRAPELLCNQIPNWVRMYLRDKIYIDVPGSDIVKAQNDRDFEQSFACVQRALRKGGYSCYGKNYLGTWMKELGGSASTPWCPGMVKN